MRITFALLFAVLAAVSSQEFGARISKLSRTGRIGQTNGYFYPEPNPSFTLPPQTPPTTTTTTTTRRPAPAPVVEEKPSEPPVDYLPPTTTTTRRPTTTARTYAQCSSGQTCALSASDCSNNNGQVASSGCLASNGQEGVCCRPIPTTTTPKPTTTARIYVQCSSGETCAASASDCANRNGQVTSNGCQASGGQEGVCCRPVPTTTTTRATTTTPRPTTVPVRTTQRPLTTTPSLEYLPPTTTKGYNYQVPENPLFPDNTNQNEQILQTTTTTKKPVVAPVVQEDDEIAFWDFRESIPGEPEIDYPIYDKIPETAFTCSGKIDGYYADIETRCQVFHVCVNVPEADPIKNSFLCPNGTLFHQEAFSCQWWPDVECASSASFFSLNENIGKVPESTAASSDVRISAGQGISASASSSSVKIAAAPNSGRKY